MVINMLGPISNGRALALLIALTCHKLIKSESLQMRTILTFPSTITLSYNLSLKH